MTNYETNVVGRSPLRYFLGLCSRWRIRRRMDRQLKKLRNSGAIIGERVALTAGCTWGGGVI